MVMSVEVSEGDTYQETYKFADPTIYDYYPTRYYKVTEAQDKLRHWIWAYKDMEQVSFNDLTAVLMILRFHQLPVNGCRALTDFSSTEYSQS